MKIRTYSELSKFTTFREKFNYLKLEGIVGEETFGFDRYLNQIFYKTSAWKRIRDFVIVRDNGCDLGVNDYTIYGKIIIHHMNPISVIDIKSQSEYLINPEYLICTSLSTHNAIHYGDESLLYEIPTERIKNDTCPWKAARSK